METSEWAKIFLDFSLFSFFIPSYYSMPASIEKNDWTCGKEDLFEISVHRFETETMSKGCRICWVKGCRVESNFLFDRHRFKFSYSRASNYIRSCPDQVEISDARAGTWQVKRSDWTVSRFMRVTRLNNDHRATVHGLTWIHTRNLTQEWQKMT